MTIEEKAVKFPLTGKNGLGKYALIDRIDLEKVSKWKWSLSAPSKGYARRSHSVGGKTKMMWMHRFVIDAPEGFDTDHINGDRLDNRRANLRVCTHQENCMNVMKTRGKSKYKGVSWSGKKKRWEVYVRYNSSSFWFGYFEDEKEAAKVYNKNAKRLHGKYAKLNIIK